VCYGQDPGRTETHELKTYNVKLTERLK